MLNIILHTGTVKKICNMIQKCSCGRHWRYPVEQGDIIVLRGDWRYVALAGVKFAQGIVVMVHIFALVISTLLSLGLPHLIHNMFCLGNPH